MCQCRINTYAQLHGLTTTLASDLLLVNGEKRKRGNDVSLQRKVFGFICGIYLLVGQGRAGQGIISGRLQISSATASLRCDSGMTNPIESCL